MTNEKYGRPVFLGSMVAEGILALIWAAAACYFFFEDPDGIAIFKSGETNAAVIVNYLTAEWLGPVGTLLAMLGVIAAPITTGDTAFRSARIMVSEVFHIDQKPLKNRLLISFPLFAAGLLILVFSLADAKGFNTIWRYFAWSNQTLAVVTLWSITVFLYRDNKPYLISMIPALFMTMVVTTFIFISPTGFGLSPTLSYFLGGIITLAIMELFHIRKEILPPRARPVGKSSRCASSSGVPEKQQSPPVSPSSGPISIPQSAHLTTSILCSTTKTVWPLEISALND
jgi:carbon starvation protein CstA